MVGPIKESEGDWLASLARQSAYSESNPKPNDSLQRRGKGGGAGNISVNNIRSPGGFLTKAQRIERRDQKRAQREERKRSAEEARQQRLARKRQKIKHGSDSAVAKPPSSGGTTRPRNSHERAGKRGMTTNSKRALSRLSNSLESTVSSHAQKCKAAAITRQSIRKGKDKKQPPVDASLPQVTVVNGLPAEPSGKATKRSTLRADSKELQPRVRDYNGQGLVRPSLYIPFNDPSFVPKLEIEFEEHVPGFFGKAKKKAAKKQADQDMLWRRCLKAKEEGKTMGSSKKGKRAKSGGDEGES
jgi:hypothetical protein